MAPNIKINQVSCGKQVRVMDAIKFVLNKNAINCEVPPVQRRLLRRAKLASWGSNTNTSSFKAKNDDERTRIRLQPCCVPCHQQLLAALVLTPPYLRLVACEKKKFCGLLRCAKHDLNMMVRDLILLEMTFEWSYTYFQHILLNIPLQK